MKHFFALLVLSICLARCEIASAASVSLDWNASASDNIAGYNVYYGTTSGNYPNKIDVGATLAVTVSNLIAGVTYYFAATAYDTNGDESGFSSEIAYVVPLNVSLVQGTTPGSLGIIQFSVTPGKWYEVQATTDFINWTTILQTGVELVSTELQFTDPYAASFPSRFYRLVQH